MALLAAGLQNLAAAGRAHTVFTVTVERQGHGDGSSAVPVQAACLHLVELAGSERLGSDGGSFKASDLAACARVSCLMWLLDVLASSISVVFCHSQRVALCSLMLHAFGCSELAWCGHDPLNHFGNGSIAASQNAIRSLSFQQAAGKLAPDAVRANRSLSALGRVLNELNVAHAQGAAAAPHIPYREDKLTFLLQVGLGFRVGNAHSWRSCCRRGCGSVVNRARLFVCWPSQENLPIQV